MTAAYLQKRRDKSKWPVYDENVWTFSCYPPHEWAYDEQNGWVNVDDDPATPTESALLDEIERLRAAGDALAAAHFDDLCDCSGAECVAIIDAHAAWEEARRG